MSFLSFANPAGLWFLPLAGLPLVIHLFRRRRAAVVPFPDIRLLQQIQNSAVRPSRIKEYLLLAVRTLILIILALSLARPMVSLNLPGWLSGATQTCVIIMDNSASMAADDQDATMLDRAKRNAIQFVKAMGSNAKVAVVSSVPGNPVICGLSVPDRAEQVLEALPQTELGTDLDGAISAADRILENARSTGGRILIFSDFPKTAVNPKNQPASRQATSPEIILFPIKAGRPFNNLIWEKVQAKPLIRKIIIWGRIQRGLIPQIGLAAGGKTIYRASPVPDREGKFTLSFGLPDQDSLYLFTAGDDLPLDDKYFLVPAITSVKKVLLLSDDRNGRNDYLFRAFSALTTAGYQIRKANTWESQYTKGFDLVVMNKTLFDGHFADGILKSVHNGAGLLVVPPLNSDPGSYNYLLKNISDITISGLADTMAHSIYRLYKAGSEDDILSDLSQAQLDGIKIRSYWQAFSRQDPALNINRADPALIFTGDKSLRVAVLLTGEQPWFGDLVFKPSFLVILLQTADHLTQRTYRQSVIGQTLAEPGRFSTAGWIRGSGGTVEAVNIATAESDLTPASGQELKKYYRNVSWQAAGSWPGALTGRSPALRLFVFFSGLLLILEMIIRASLKI
jgi:hypothetical protein